MIRVSIKNDVLYHVNNDIMICFKIKDKTLIFDLINNEDNCSGFEENILLMKKQAIKKTKKVIEIYD